MKEVIDILRKENEDLKALLKNSIDKLTGINFEALNNMSKTNNSFRQTKVINNCDILNTPNTNTSISLSNISIDSKSTRDSNILLRSSVKNNLYKY